ncbi:Small ubiquitin- modifier 1 [Tyrophagus putrescentiae]|nr:Small ubiquitin- modifier 1 [Tyrophagus putrescentiae]
MVEADNRAENPDHIVIKVFSHESNREYYFRVKKTTFLRKLKKAYSDIIGLPISSLRFFYDGHRIDDEDTPLSLDLEEDDVIQVFQW